VREELVDSKRSEEAIKCKFKSEKKKLEAEIE